jgi:phosphoglucomutase
VAEQILILEKTGKQDRFIMGFEESVGYLFGQNVRDKDAVAGAMLLCEMASFWKLQGMDLVDILETLYEKYGRFFIRR